MAEGEGFEPPEVLPSTVFKTAAISRSAIPPEMLDNDKAKLKSLSTADYELTEARPLSVIIL